MRIPVRVTRGLGKGGKFVSMPIYKEIFEEILGKEPFPGTLNLEADEKGAVAVGNHFMKHGKLYDGLVLDGKKMGAIETVEARLWIGNERRDVVLVRPALTVHRKSTIEVISDIYLREEFGLQDGSELELEVKE